MTDEQIIKALECHADTDIATCKICAYDGVGRCGHQLCYDTLDLIHRKDEKIEALIAGQETLQKNLSKEIRIEAYKELADRLKKIFWTDTIWDVLFRKTVDMLVSTLMSAVKTERNVSTTSEEPWKDAVMQHFTKVE